MERRGTDNAMRNRNSTLLWMKDLIEQMSRCQEQLQWAGDNRTESFLADKLIGDLTECRKLAEELRTTKSRGRELNAV